MFGWIKKILGFSGEVTLDALIINGIPRIWNALKGVHAALPDEFKQKLPGFLGISLADESIFNGVLGQLDSKDQVVITNFLFHCKDYERNRFVNIVAGMEVIEKGKVDETKESFDDNGKKVVEKKSSSKDKKDKREEFLKNFAKVISQEFNGDFDKAHDFCVGGRMILKDPFHQKVLRKFSESTKWFKNFVLGPLNASSLSDLRKFLSENSKFWADKGVSAKERYQAKVAARKAKK